MLVQSKLRSTFVRVFLLRVSPKTLPLPFCLLPVKNVRLFHLRKIRSLILIVWERKKNISKKSKTLGILASSVTKIFSISQRNTFSLTKKKHFLFRDVIPYKVRWNCRQIECLTSMGFLACSITKEEMVGKRPELATRRGFGSPFWESFFVYLFLKSYFSSYLVHLFENHRSLCLPVYLFVCFLCWFVCYLCQ